MNPAKVRREKLHKLTDLPNIGQAMVRNLQRIGITAPQQLVGKDPLKLYEKLCRETGSRHDPCVLDVFISITRFIDGEAPQPWWHYSEERKQRYGTELKRRDALAD